MGTPASSATRRARANTLFDHFVRVLRTLDVSTWHGDRKVHGHAAVSRSGPSIRDSSAIGTIAVPSAGICDDGQHRPYEAEQLASVKPSIKLPIGWPTGHGDDAQILFAATQRRTHLSEEAIDRDSGCRRNPVDRRLQGNRAA